MGTEPSDITRKAHDGRTTGIGKRGFLKLLGVGALAVGGTAGASTAQSGGGSLANRVDITGANDEPARYRLGTSGALVPAPGTVERWDSTTETTAEGWVPGSQGSDTYYFAGGLVDFEFVEGAGRVTVNGRPVDPAAVRAGWEHSITIRGRGEPTNYVFEVSGGISPTDTETKERWDEFGGANPVGEPTRVDGWVTAEGDVDTFFFDGEVERFAFERGDATVEVDARPVDDPESLTNVGEKRYVEIRGTGEPANYAFSVSGELHASTESTERWDAVSERAAEGWVTATTDSDVYYYTGELVEFEIRQGTADVTEGEYEDPVIDE
ncbi:hypothetical protein ACFQE1_14905 [Halobium palmae]|uniref:Uncharacterized protein n=1 Tax=Halobium palmae TaxID=1776492 RepID=A0ABD5S3P3_9EURY